MMVRIENNQALGLDVIPETGGQPPRRRRRFWRWRPGHLFERHSPVGIGILVIFIAFGFAYIMLRDDSAVGLDRSSAQENEKGVTAVEPRELTGAEHVRATRFGRPLRLGPGGLPLVEVEPDVVRELTALENDYPLGVTALADPNRPGVMMAPGPVGEGVWWQEGGPLSALPEAEVVDRNRWFREQRLLLRKGLNDLGGALTHLGYVKPMDWSPDWGGHLETGTSAMRDYYSFGDYKLWPLAPSRWVCSEALEVALTQGVTDGCPSVAHVAALGQVWAHIGNLNELLWALGRSVHLASELERYELNASEYQVELLQDIYWEMDSLKRARAHLEAVGYGEGAVIQVEFSERWR